MGRTKRSVVLCVGMALLLFLGLIYAYSVLLAPLKAEFAWPMSGMTFIFALSISAFTVGGLASGRLMARRRVRRGLLLGASLLLVGFLGVPHAAGAESLAFAALMYGMLASFGIGLVYNIVIPVVSAWFPDKPGFAQGVCLMGFGMGGFLLGPLATGLYAMFPWRVVIGCLGVVFAALIVASSFVIRAPRLDEIGLPEPVAGPARDAGAGEGECHGLLSSPVFYLEFLFLFFMGSNGMGITGIGRELPLTLGVDDMAAAFIIGFVNIGSGIGRFGGGVLLDRIGCERSMLGIAVMGVASPAIVAASLAMGSVALQLSGCLLFGVSWGGGDRDDAVHHAPRVGPGRSCAEHGGGQHPQHFRGACGFVRRRVAHRGDGFVLPGPGCDGGLRPRRASGGVWDGSPAREHPCALTWLDAVRISSDDKFERCIDDF